MSRLLVMVMAGLQNEKSRCGRWRYLVMAALVNLYKKVVYTHIYRTATGPTPPLQTDTADTRPMQPILAVPNLFRIGSHRYQYILANTVNLGVDY